MKDICSGIEKIREVGTAAEPAGGGAGGLKQPGNLSVVCLPSSI